MKLTRKQRKERVRSLVSKWCDEVGIAIRRNSADEETLRRMFLMFCIREKIDRPQDGSLRDNVLLKSVEELKGRSKFHGKEGKKWIGELLRKIVKQELKKAVNVILKCIIDIMIIVKNMIALNLEKVGGKNEGNKIKN